MPNRNVENLTQWIELARSVAHKAHADQWRRDRITPYVRHPERVAERVPDELKPIALLHDVCEDTGTSLTDLTVLGFPAYIISGVDSMTQRANEDYDEYIRRVCRNPDAVLVKIADIEDNMNDGPSSKAKTKYMTALKKLNSCKARGPGLSGNCLPLLLAIFLPILVHAADASDSEVRRLQRALDAAQTQGDVNIASSNICKFWDTKLGAIEKKVREELNDRERKNFSNATEQWQKYRRAEVEFRASRWEGGSIQPLEANLTYAQLTERRVKDLQDLDREMRQQRVIPQPHH